MKSWLSNKLRSDKASSSRDDAGRPQDPTRNHQPLVNAVYYPNWKVYKGQAPSSLVADCITHVFYAFAWPTEQGTIALSDEYADVTIEVDAVQGCMAALSKLKSQYPHLKTLLSIGGGGAGSSHFARVARSEDLRTVFAKNVRDLVDLHNFNGVDIDWEHPQSSREGSHYVALLAELRKVLPGPEYLLTSALPAGEWALQHINLSEAASYLDFINVMTYDFAGPWVSQVGHHAQLVAPKRPHNDAAKVSGGSAVRYFLSHGVPSQKVILGIPAYGRSFLGASGIGSNYSGHAGEEGTFEYRDLPRPGATEYTDLAHGAAYCVGGDGGFVTYDNVETVQMKGEFALGNQLGGLFYWTATGDAVGSRSLVVAGYNALQRGR